MLSALSLKHYKTAESYIEQVDSLELNSSTTSILAKAEIEYNLSKYEQAINSYKNYSKRKDADLDYANYAIGHSFYNFYRFNSTAWYWLKNLSQTEKTQWDSLAVIELAKLYTHTGHPKTAAMYFRRIRRKYASVLNGQLLESYFENLLGRKKFLFLEKELKHFDMEITDSNPVYSALAKFHYEQQNFENALHYYSMLPLQQLSDRQILRFEKCEYLLRGDFKEEEFLSNFVARYPNNEFSGEIRNELMNYYFQLENYDKAIAISDSLEENLPDNKLLKLKALAQLKRTKVALNYAASVLIDSTNIPISDDVLSEIEQLLLSTGIKETSNYFESIIDSLNNNVIHNKLILSLANLYEQKHLYSEANRIYESILADSSFTEPEIPLFKMISNLESENRYHNAITIISHKYAMLSRRGQIKALEKVYQLSILKRERDILPLLTLFYSFPEYERRNWLLTELALVHEESNPQYSDHFKSFSQIVGTRTEASIEDSINILNPVEIDSLFKIQVEKSVWNPVD